MLVALVAIAFVVALWLGVVALLSFVFMIAWNAAIPAIFGGPTIEFGVAFAVIVILTIIGQVLRR